MKNKKKYTLEDVVELDVVVIGDGKFNVTAICFKPEIEIDHKIYASSRKSLMNEIAECAVGCGFPKHIKINTTFDVLPEDLY